MALVPAPKAVPPILAPIAVGIGGTPIQTKPKGGERKERVVQDKAITRTVFTRGVVPFMLWWWQLGPLDGTIV